MRLSELELREAPGLPGGLPPLTLAPGLNLVVGPNASGKSTLSRAVRALLWEATADPDLMASATFELGGGERRRAHLVHGRVAWAPGRPALPPDEAAPQYALGLVDLLRAGQADQAIARRLAVELAGGFDLEAALTRFNGSTAAPAALSRAREQARRALREAEARQAELAALEETLADLKRRRARADEARRTRRLADKAAELARARVALAGLEAQLAALPEAAARLRGDELERLRELEDEARLAQEALADVGRALERNAVLLSRLRFSRPTPGDEELRRWSTLSSRLGESLRVLRAARVKLAEAAAREASTRAEVLAPEARAAEGLRAGALDALEAELEGLRARQGQREASRRVVDAWASVAARGEAVDEAALRRGVEALRGWLRTPPPETRRVVPGPAWLPPLLMGGGALLTAWGLVAASVALALLGGLAAGAGLAMLVTLALWRPAEDGREAFAREARAAGCAPDGDWDAGAVTARLQALERQLDRLREQDVVRTRLAEAELAAAAAEREVAHYTGQLAERVRSIGLSEHLAAATIAQQARAVGRWLDAKAALEGTRAAVEALEADVRSAAAQLRGWLGELGVTASERDEDLAGDVEDVRARAERARQGRAQREELDRQRVGCRARVHEVARAVAAVWERAGLEAGDREGLAALEAARQRRQRVLAEVEAGRAGVERLVAEVGRLAEGRALPVRPEALSEAEADTWCAALEAEAGEFEGLVAQVAEIEAQIEAATRGRALEDARAAVAEAEAALREAREARRSDALARLVLEAAREQQGGEHAPPILARARAWLGAFTHHGWRLEVDAGEQGRFLAVDTRSGQARALGQLSDATRVQLLLAARLAAIEQQEAASGPLPLCLDELLSTTDEARFLAVAAALLQLADGGRQILYFTADAGEVAQWQAACARLGHAAPHVVDLGAARGRGAAWGEALAVAPPGPREVPAPEGDDADAYARRLGVEAPSMHTPAEAWHLIHVMYDDLPALHRCLSRGLDRVGPLRQALRLSPEALDLPTALVARVTQRARLLEATLEALRVGRGRPVTWPDLAASGAVTRTFEARVKDLLTTHGHDAAAFCRAAAALPHFRSAAAEQLEAHLEASGILDPRPPLPREAIVDRALATLWHDPDPALTAPEAAAFVEAVLAKTAHAPPSPAPPPPTRAAAP